MRLGDLDALTGKLKNGLGNARAAQANISAACVGYLGKKTAYGYMWRYES